MPAPPLSEPSTTEPQARKRPVAIDRVIDLAETRGVRPVDRDHVARLALAVDQLPPIDVVKLDGDRFGILAGYHRMAAHRLAEKRTIRIVVHDLAVEEWHPFAVSSNLTHGLPLTLAQRKAAARQMLDDTPRRSDRAIAVDCGLDHKTVGKLRETDEAIGEVPQTRTGRDGKVRRMPGPTHAEAREAILANNEPDPVGLVPAFRLLEEQERQLDYITTAKPAGPPMDHRAVAPLIADLRWTFKRFEEATALGLHPDDRAELLEELLPKWQAMLDRLESEAR